AEPGERSSAQRPPHPDRCRIAPTPGHPLPQAERVMSWRASVLTIFPDMFPGPLAVSLCGKALTTGLWALDVIDIRDFATDKHRSVDDTPAGGGPGMVMEADVVARAVDATAPEARPRALLSARGSPVTHR